MKLLILWKSVHMKNAFNPFINILLFVISYHVTNTEKYFNLSCFLGFHMVQCFYKLKKIAKICYSSKQNILVTLLLFLITSKNRDNILQLTKIVLKIFSNYFEKKFMVHRVKGSISIIINVT